jgi:hypothetical protein
VGKEQRTCPRRSRRPLRSSWPTGGWPSRPALFAPQIGWTGNGARRLRRLLDAAVGGSGGLVLIGGEAGIGKTALAVCIE